MKKKILLVPGIRDVKSIQSAGIRSIPKIHRSAYLELYNLQRTKDRLERESHILGKRENSAQRQMEDINQRIEKLHKQVRKELRGNPRKNRPSKPLKTMAISY